MILYSPSSTIHWRLIKHWHALGIYWANILRQWIGLLSRI